MIKLMKPLLLFSLMLLIYACSNSIEPSGEKMTGKIDYWVEIGNPVEQEYDQNWLKADVRKQLVSDLLEKAKSGELPVYYYMDDTLMPMEKDYLAYLFHHTDTEYVMVEEQMQVIPYEVDLNPEAIVRLKFREQWYWDKSNNEFFKKVIAICPMVERYKNENEILGYTGLFWIYLEGDTK